jgi:DNA polymerase-1
MNRTLLIDADILAYRVASAAEVPINWGDDFWTLHADARLAKETLDIQVRELYRDLLADSVQMCLTDRDNFRKTIYPLYKANRAKIRRPMILPSLREHILAHYTTFMKPGLEADDCLGILATMPRDPEDQRIIVSIDKDLRSIPGLHYELNKPDEGIFEVTETEADRWHMMQTLTGDSTDGYPGCPGQGPVGAAKTLDQAEKQDVESWWPLVVGAYAKKSLGEEEALTMARVARICRASDYDFDKQEVILWSPPR